MRRGDWRVNMAVSNKGSCEFLRKKEKTETVLKDIKEIKKITNDLTIFKSPSGGI